MGKVAIEEDFLRKKYSSYTLFAIKEITIYAKMPTAMPKIPHKAIKAIIRTTSKICFSFPLNLNAAILKENMGILETINNDKTIMNPKVK